MEVRSRPRIASEPPSFTFRLALRRTGARSLPSAERANHHGPLRCEARVMSICCASIGATRDATRLEGPSTRIPCHRKYRKSFPNRRAILRTALVLIGMAANGSQRFCTSLRRQHDKKDATDAFVRHREESPASGLLTVGTPPPLSSKQWILGRSSQHAVSSPMRRESTRRPRALATTDPARELSSAAAA